MATREAPAPADDFPTSASGFTLLEMLVALVIAGLASVAIGHSLWGWLAQSGYRTTLVKLDGMVAEARTAALRQRRAIALELTDQKRTLAVPTLGLNYALPKDVDVTFTGVDAREDGPSDSVAIYFLADGSTTGARIEVRSKGSSAHRRIGWVSGRLSAEGAGDG